MKGKINEEVFVRLLKRLSVGIEGIGQYKMSDGHAEEVGHQLYMEQGK